MPEAAVLEKPMLYDAEKLLEMRNRIRQEQTPKFAKDVTPPAPSTSETEEQRKEREKKEEKSELQRKLDQKIEDLINKSEEEREEEKEKIPEIVLRKKESWDELGWTQEKRNRISRKLKELLKLTDDNADNACNHMMEIFIASGKTADQVLEILENDEKNNELVRQAQEEAAKYAAPRGITNIEKYTKLNYLQKLAGTDREDWIQRFVLDKDFAEELNQQYRQGYAENLYDLAWNIAYSQKDDFGIDGAHPIVQMQIHKKEDGSYEGRYVVNQSNFMLWMRKEMFKFYSEMDTYEVTNYFQRLQVSKGNFTSVTLGQMIVDSDTYFRDETGHKWGRLYDQALLEPYMLMTIREYYIEYDKVQSSEEKLSELYNNVFYLSKFTAKMYGGSMMNLLSTLSEDFEGKDSDTKLGEAWMKMFMVYYNMADFEGLQKVLGKDSEFFTKKFWMDAIVQVYGDDAKQLGMPALGRYLGPKTDSFLKAFGSDGKVTDKTKDDFIAFVNVFTTPTNASSPAGVVDQGLKNVVAHLLASKEANVTEKNKKDVTVDSEGKVLDSISLNYAWLIAQAMTLPMGAASKNNVWGFSGHNAETKWLYPRQYRMKYETYGGAGNPFSVAMFKQLSIPFLEGVLLENANGEFKTKWNKEKGAYDVETRQQTPIEVINKMIESSNRYESERKRLQSLLEEAKKANNEAKQAEILKLIAENDDKAKNEYKMKASQLVFHQNAMRNYAQNIIGRAKDLYATVFSANEINFEKFTHYDSLFRGVSFDRAAFQKEIQSGLITPLRYLFNANGATQLNMEVRAPVYKGRDEKGKQIWAFETMPLAEAMIGYEVLNIPQFRKKVDDLSPEDWKKMRQQGYRKRGEFVLRPDGRYLLDANKMYADKTLVYKQWMLMKLGSDLWAHISRHSTDPAYDMHHYMSILEAIESIPGDIEADEFKMRKTRITGRFFSEEQLKWLRKISGTSTFNLFNRQFWSDLFFGDRRKKESKFGESVSLFLSSIFRGS